jgi:hypothetical protein
MSNKAHLLSLPYLSNMCLSSQKMFQFTINIFLVLTTTDNLSGAEMCVAEMQQA